MDILRRFPHNHDYNFFYFFFQRLMTFNDVLPDGSRTFSDEVCFKRLRRCLSIRRLLFNEHWCPNTLPENQCNLLETPALSVVDYSSAKRNEK